MNVTLIFEANRDGAKAADLQAASGLFAVPYVNSISRDAPFSCFISFSWRREEPTVALN